MIKTLRNLLILVCMLSPLASFAQDKGQNGGDTDEIEFKLIAKKINQWLQVDANVARYQEELNKAQLIDTDAVTIRQMMSDLKALSVVFTNDPVHLRIEGQSRQINTPDYIDRVCINFNTITGMFCNRPDWEESGDHLKYILVFHEILGGKILEQNQDIFSVYDYALALSPFFKEIQNGTGAPPLSGVLTCANSKYALQMNPVSSGTQYVLLKNGSPVNDGKTSFKILDVANTENAQTRVYLQLEHSGLISSKTILQCSSSPASPSQDK